MIDHLDYCSNCEYREDCELVDNINFCEDCKDYYSCGLCYIDCKAGHPIECNNGFELENDYGDDEDEE